MTYRHKLKFHLLNLTSSLYSLLVYDHEAMAESVVFLSGTDGTMAYLIFFFFWFVVQVALVVKDPPANVGYTRDRGSIPGSGRCPGEGNGNPLQYSCLESSMDRGV